jgi:VWFA-related protein
MKKPFVLCLCLAACFLALRPEAGRVVIQQVDTSLYPEMKVFLSVLDGSGQPLLGLKAGNFQVVENGVEISGLRAGTVFKNMEWLAISLVLDRSGSMAGEFLSQAKTAASDFVANLGLGDRVALVTFDSVINLAQDFVQEKASVRELIASLTAGSNTALYDAVLFALEAVKKQASPRKAVITLTDGKDTHSQATIDDCLRVAKEAGIPIFVIGLGQSLNEDILRAIAESSGGGYFPAPQARDLLEIYRRISSQLENQYVLMYRSSALNAKGVGTLLVNLILGDETAHDRRYFSLVRDVPTAGAEETLASPGAGVPVQQAPLPLASKTPTAPGLPAFVLGGGFLGLVIAGLLLLALGGSIRAAGRGLKAAIIILAAALFALAGLLIHFALYGGIKP